jgi:hypothetical protein
MEHAPAAAFGIGAVARALKDFCNCGLTQQYCYVDAENERQRLVPDPDWPGHYCEFRPGDDAAGIWACSLMRYGESYFL